MDRRNRVFDDAARVAGGAMGALAGVRREVETLVRHQIDRILSNMDVVSRDEFEAVREMAATARREQARLEERVAVLEASLAGNKEHPVKARAASRARATKPSLKER